MKYNIRPIEDSDWEEHIIPWYKKYNQKAKERSFYPPTAIIIEKDGIAVASMFIILTNCSVALPTITISDKDYKGDDRADILKILVEASHEYCKSIGFDYVFSFGLQSVMGKVFEEAGMSKSSKLGYEYIKNLTR